MKPLLAEKLDLDRVRFPYLTSVKYDGFRCLVSAGGEPPTRSMKPIPNNYVRGKLQEMKLNYLDGELLTTTNGKVDDFNTVQSKLATRSGMPDFEYHIFDHFGKQFDAFTDRLETARLKVSMVANPKVKIVDHQFAMDIDQLLAQEDAAVSAGWEGLMLRSPQGVYKFGRSTVVEGILLKMKRIDDDEGEVVSVKERVHNANEATTNVLGYTERSSHKANMVGTDSLGTLIVKWRDTTFGVGTGFTEA